MAKIQERDLLKALNELEDMVAKGDPLEESDPEGGLSTEGKPLSDSAPSGRSDTLKSNRVDRVLSGATAGEGVDPENPWKKKKRSSNDDSSSTNRAHKAMPKDVDSDGDDLSDTSSSPDDDSGDDASSEEPARRFGKSLRDRADGDETMRKAIEVSDFIEAMVDQTSGALVDVQKSLVAVSRQLSSRMEKSEAAQSNFNSRLAKAVVSIGNSVNGLSEIVGKLAGQPHIPQRKAMLSKSEIVDPYLGGEPSGGEFADFSREQIQEWLFQKSCANEIDPVTVTIFEQNGFNPEVLPPHVRKALVNDLHK